MLFSNGTSVSRHVNSLDTSHMIFDSRTASQFEAANLLWRISKCTKNTVLGSRLARLCIRTQPSGVHASSCAQPRPVYAEVILSDTGSHVQQLIVRVRIVKLYDWYQNPDVTSQCPTSMDMVHHRTYLLCCTGWLYAHTVGGRHSP